MSRAIGQSARGRAAVGVGSGVALTEGEGAGDGLVMATTVEARGVEVADVDGSSARSPAIEAGGAGIELAVPGVHAPSTGTSNGPTSRVHLVIGLTSSPERRA